MDRCNGRRDITKLLLKTALNIIQSISQTQVLTTLTKKAFETIEGKGENAGKQHFLLSEQCFHRQFLSSASHI